VKQSSKDLTNVPHSLLLGQLSKVYIYQILVLVFDLYTEVIAKPPVGAKAHNPARHKEWTTHFTLSGGPSWHLT
jgi:hypothetical protein